MAKAALLSALQNIGILRELCRTGRPVVLFSRFRPWCPLPRGPRRKLRTPLPRQLVHPGRTAGVSVHKLRTSSGAWL